MNRYMQWIRALRLSVTIPAGLVVHIGFKISGKETDWYLVFFILTGAAFTMLLNDYVDRTHDLKKKKSFAYENAKKLKSILVVGWICIFLLAITIFLKYSPILIPVILISILYSHCRDIPYLQTCCVAFCSASPILMTMTNIDTLSHITIQTLFFWAIFISILGREIVKDIEDVEIDRGWKQTPATLKTNIAGAYYEAKWLIYVGSFLAFLALSPTPIGSSRIPNILLSVGILLCFMGGAMLGKNNAKIGKNFFDYGMLLTLLSVIVC